MNILCLKNLECVVRNETKQESDSINVKKRCLLSKFSPILKIRICIFKATPLETILRTEKSFFFVVMFKLLFLDQMPLISEKNMKILLQGQLTNN